MFKFIELMAENAEGTGSAPVVIQVPDILKIEPRPNRDQPDFPKAAVFTRSGEIHIVSDGKGYKTVKERLAAGGYEFVS